MFTFNRLHPTTLYRIASVLGVALILMLSVLAVRSDWHELFCHHEAESHACSHREDASPAHQHGEAGDIDSAEGCVVTLFAQGHVLAALFFALSLFIAIVRIVSGFPTRVLALVSVDHRWPHGCGPPLA
ncbi:hypothetical protein OH491_01295 [Termitidicoccus mucosus]|uniref:Uncharacterized protein n=1 Tax=Termitidicoccus mucosus TaxID=1184151 RepID=A0A178IKG8_9BACT|nr:hypothetical protein AW736_08245 [Opitutaceae bacterium TSB47]OAM91844.1 hypothetical protein AW736_26660 [Opitutaceae bacterium TSB47]